MELAKGLCMIIELWDSGITQEIEDYIKNNHNVKWSDYSEAKIEIIENEDGETEISDADKLFLAREIADEILNNPQ